MSGTPHRPRIAAALLLAALTLAASGCSNPYANTPAPPSQSATVQNTGEPPAPAPTAGQLPARLQATPQAALAQFAGLYTNWTWRTLVADQQTLAAIGTGAARLAEQQAAASSRADSTLARGHVANHGELLGATPDLHRAGWWIVITSEQTTGSAEYETLPASDHVTLAQVQRTGGGWAVSQWLPQS